jgi:Polysaccharide lyase family 4, domain II
MIVNRLLLSFSAAAVAALAGCSSGGECKLNDPNSCPSDQICEVVQGREKPLCFDPVQIEGRVFDLDSNAGVADARVTAQDANGAPLGGVAESGSDGKYTLRIPTERSDEKGTPIGGTVTLRASAKDYQSFPSGVRMALPIQTASATRADDGSPWVLQGGPVDVGLFKLPQAQIGFPAIRGKVDVSADQSGVLVVAETSSGQGQLVGYSAVADASGDFVIFNVPAGTYTLRAYSSGVNYEPFIDATVTSGTDLTGIEIHKTTASTATVEGDISIVSAGGLTSTSVILVVRSTFNPTIVRGEAPAGLRVGGVSGHFAIPGVPDGEYAVLAGFENDALVRDPNTGTAGTDLQYVTVSGGAVVQPTDIFKVTDAVVMVGPGAEALEKTSVAPTFTWQAYASASAYELLVFDAFGNPKWLPPQYPVGLGGLPSSGDVTVTYAGDALESGKIYQWRVVSHHQNGQPNSQTEDLRGVFQVE